MSDSKQVLHLSPWLGGSILTLLALQVGLLWIHGNMLQRQHEAILDLREDVQSLAETLEQDEEEGDASADGNPVPAHRRLARRPRSRLARTCYLQEESDADSVAKKETADANQSALDAVAKAREIQKKVSIPENIRIAKQKERELAAVASVGAEGRRWRPWLWAGAGLAVLAMVAGASMRRRG